MNEKALLAGLSLALCPSLGVGAQEQQVGLAPGAVMSESFGQASPQGWELLPGAQVQLVDGDSALVCGHGGHGVWIAAQARDLTLQFRYRPGQGAGRVALSASGEPPNAQEYSVLLAPGEIGVDRVASGAVQNLGGGAIVLQPGSWYDMSVQVASGRISVSVAGQTVVTAVDSQPLPAGAVAFGALDGSGFAFDDVVLMPAGGGQQPTEMIMRQVQDARMPSGTQPSRVQTVAPMPSVPPSAMPSPSMPASGQVLAGSPVPFGSGVYLYIDGIHQGSKKDRQNWTEIDAFEFSIGSVTSAQRAGNAAAAFEPLKITKSVDATSPFIYLYGARGDHLTQVSLEVVDSTGTIYMGIQVGDVRIVGVETKGTNGSDFSETIDLSFTKVIWEVTDSGGKTVKKGWDLKANTNL